MCTKFKQAVGNIPLVRRSEFPPQMCDFFTTGILLTFLWCENEKGRGQQNKTKGDI